MTKPHASGLSERLASLSSALSGRIVTPGDRDYARARRGWNPRFAPFPLAVVYCQTVEDIIRAVSWAREHDVIFRVRSGGHALEGWSTVDGGIVIDVSPMNQVQIDEQARMATVQTGIQIGDLLAKLATKGLTIPFGDSASVGVGGITLGGGIGVLGRTMGLICDNLEALEMVIASGPRGAERVRADAREHADLLWASRGGGGGNFGVATTFSFRLHPVPNTVPIYDVSWPWDQAEAVLDAWQTTAPASDERFGSMLELFSRSVGRHRMHGLFLGSEAELRRILQPLVSIGSPEVMVRTVPYLEATRFLTDAPTGRHHIDRAPVKIKFSSAWAHDPLPGEAVTLARTYLENSSADAFSIFLLTMGGAVSRTPVDATAFPHRQATFYLEWDTRWTHEASEQAAITAVETMRLAMQPFVSGSYVNVPDPGIAGWEAAYYGANAGRLRRIKQRYDPDNVFRFEQSIPPS